jgi:hypothetical protein
MEGAGLKNIVLVIAVLGLIGIVVAEEQGDNCGFYKEEKKMTFTAEQHVSGTGFFSTYRYALMPDVLGTEGALFNGVELRKKSHGSGNIDTESLFSGEHSYSNTSHCYAEDEEKEIEILKRREEIEVIDEYDEETTSVVALKEDSKITHIPIAMAIGTRYFALHPIAFKSLINDETWVKNRDSFNSLNHRIEEAHGLNMALYAQSDATNTTMNVTEDLTNGKAHFGALQLAGIPREEESEEETEGEAVPSPGPAMKAWHAPIAEVATDYIGTYHISNNMTLMLSDDETDYEAAWLPCCFGGYLEMPMSYQKGASGFGSNVRSIFDCSCTKVPSRAEFS